MHQVLFSLLLVFLPTQLGLHFWPSWALVLGRRLDYLSPTLYATDILIIFLLISWLIEKRKNIFSFKKYYRSSCIKILCFLLFICINIYFAANRMVATFAWVKIAEFAALGVYIVKEKPKLTSIIFPLSAGVFYSSGIAIIQFILQHSVGGMFWLLGERTFSATTPGIARIDANFLFFKLRSYATFPHPNVLGGFLAVLLPLIIIQFTLPRRQAGNLPIYQFTNTKKIFYITTIVLGIIALVLTFSRSAWVVAALGGVYLIVKHKKRLFFPVLFCAVLIIFFIGTTFGFQDESVVVRQQLNAAALSMARASPITGNGLGNYLVQLPDHLVSRQIYFLQPVHNIYLLLLSETGILGCAIFGWIVWTACKKKNLTIIRYSLFSILLLGLVDHYLLTLQQGQLLFTLFLSLSLAA
jgi:O-antigen ligase